MLDLTGAARLEVSNTFAPYEVFLTAGAIYFCITTSLSWLLRKLEQRLSIENRAVAQKAKDLQLGAAAHA